jgi:hypothetical protein
MSDEKIEIHKDIILDLKRYLEKNKHQTLDFSLAEFSAISTIPIIDLYQAHMQIYGESDFAKQKIRDLKDFYAI